MNTGMNTNIQYTADIDNVKEVILYGGADLAYWQQTLAPLGLEPVSHEGSAQMLLSVTDLKYMGVRFNEFTLSVLVAASGNRPSGYYLAHAYNTSGLFALMERAFFSTPYYHASIELKDTVPASFSLRDGSGVVLSAMFGGTTAARTEIGVWEGPIYLPMRVSNGGATKLFYASLGGETAIYPFSPADTFRVQSPQPRHALQMLVESHFTPFEWRICSNAKHKKSKTYAS